MPAKTDGDVSIDGRLASASLAGVVAGSDSDGVVLTEERGVAAAGGISGSSGEADEGGGIFAVLGACASRGGWKSDALTEENLHCGHTHWA